MSSQGGTRTVPVRTPPRAASGPAPASGSRESEHVVARLRHSGRHLVWPVLWFLLVCFATGYLWVRLEEPWMRTALPFAAAALVVLLTVLPLLHWMNRITIITTRRLIVKRGFVVRERTEFLLGRGSEATLRRGPLQLLAGSGDVTVHAGAAGSMVLRDMPRAKLVHAAVADLIEHATGPAGAQTPTRRAFVN